MRAFRGTRNVEGPPERASLAGDATPVSPGWAERAGALPRRLVENQVRAASSAS
jgi:hypothetical protein